MAKLANNSNKLTFGKRKSGKAIKSHNKHNSKSSYARNNARKR